MLLGGGYLGQRVDMWALGVCLYAMLCGCLPFDEPDMEVRDVEVRDMEVRDMEVRDLEVRDLEVVTARIPTQRE
eukprot:scaffold25596_cov84-Isochrysis_galbana.AAC.1